MKPQCTLRAILIGLLMLSAACAIAVWIWQERYAKIRGERHNRRSIKQVLTAQRDYYTNDRDANGAADFWVADVSGFYRIREPGSATTLRLIEHSVARADVRPCLPPQRHGWVDFPRGGSVYFDGLPDSHAPCEGYLYVALESYEEEPGRWVKYDDGSGRNPTRFGLCQYPAMYGNETRFTFIVNESGILYHNDTGGLRPRGFPFQPEKDGWRR